MKRGDLITAAASGDQGKPRPALVIQLACLLATTLRDEPLYRLTVPPVTATGLRQPSQVMVDKIIAVRRERCGPPVGRADDASLLALGRPLAFVVGVAG